MKNNKNFYLKFNNLDVDITLAIYQNLALDYEKVIHFLHLIDFWSENNAKNYCIVDFRCHKNLVNCGFEIDEIKIKNLFNSYLEGIWFYLNLILDLTKLIYKSFLYSSKKKKVFSNIDYAFYNFSGYDFASKEYEADFSKIISNSFDSSRCLFILPREPCIKEKHFLEQKNIQFINQNIILNNISIRKISEIFKFILFECIFKIRSTRSRILFNFIIRNIIRDINIYQYVSYLNIKKLISAQGAGVIESPVTCFANSRGIKTIFWESSGVGIKHVNSGSPENYFYEQLEQSFVLANIRLVWNSLDVELLKKRNLNNLFNKDLNVKMIGPLMSGNSKWMNISSKEARDRYGFAGNTKCKIWISIFDLPIFNINGLIDTRYPCNDHPIETQNMFFEDMIKILEKYDDVGLIYKPKRPLNINNNGNRIIPKKLQDFADTDNPFIRNKRIIILPSNLDPYLSIALCDKVIAMPFTSALQAAIYYGKDGIYYDPFGYNNRVFPRYIKKILRLNQSELFENVDNWLMSDYKISNTLKNNFSYIGDPQTNFYKKIISF